MSFKEISGIHAIVISGISGISRTFCYSSLTLCIASAVGIHSASAAQISSADSDIRKEQLMVVTADTDSGIASNSEHSYTVPATRAGTKLNLTQRDIPQSVSVLTQQRIRDQDLQNVGDALTNVTGISASQNDSERVDIYSRGFYINNYTYDDIPSTQTGAWNFGETDGDSAIYERIDVVRGSTGLMTGTGNPGAAINMIRKKADSKKFVGNLSASYGSWDNQRYVADLSGPLNNSGTIRGRVVTGSLDAYK